MSLRHSLQNAVALTLLAAAPVSVVGVSEKLIDLMDALQCSDGQICGPVGFDLIWYSRTTRLSSLSSSLRSFQVAVNCTFNSSRGSTVGTDFGRRALALRTPPDSLTRLRFTRSFQWLEITDNSNMTQYASSTPNVTTSDLPDPVPPPYSLTSTVYAAPANNGTCFSRSPTLPASCGPPGSDECLIEPTIFDIEWLLFGELVCSGSFPKGGTTSLNDVVPPPGSVTVIATKQCKDYLYTPPWYASVTDQWGNKWALQTSQEEMADDAAWAANLDAVVWPEGWVGWENVTLTTNRTHVSYLMGDICWSFVLRDSQDNTWHMYEYPEKIGALC